MCTLNLTSRSFTIYNIIIVRVRRRYSWLVQLPVLPSGRTNNSGMSCLSSSEIDTLSIFSFLGLVLFFYSAGQYRSISRIEIIPCVISSCNAFLISSQMLSLSETVCLNASPNLIIRSLRLPNIILNSFLTSSMTASSAELSSSSGYDHY